MKSMWVEEDRDDPVRVHGVKRMNIFFCLMCWQVKIDQTLIFMF
jgi:hypothetical protein